MKIQSGKFIVCLLSLFFLSATIFAQTTAFNFQGRLNDGGNAANSNYDFRFKLFDALSGGAQVGATIDRANLQVIGGVFSTVLDFGASPFLEGENSFLEIAVRPAGSPNAHVVLGARQQILAVPLAVRATSASFAVTANVANVANDSNALGGIEAANFARLNTPNSGNFIVNGNTQITQSLTTNQIAVQQNAIVGGNVNISGNSTVSGNSGVGGTSTLNGNIIQPPAVNGAPKAMLYIFSPGSAPAVIARCYNGVTGSSTNNCGFTLSEPLGGVGVYRINFGFQISSRFVNAMSEYGGSTTSIQNAVPQFKFIDSTTIDFYLTAIEKPADTTPFSFMVMIF